MKRLLITLTIPVLALLAINSSANSQCPTVNCNCSAFQDEGWRLACESEEQRIKEKCASAGGKPQNFCRLQGPLASPVALSIADVLIVNEADQSVKFLSEAAATKMWSVQDDFKTLKSQTNANKFGDALQVLKILDSHLNSAFETQMQVLAALESENKKKKLVKQGAAFSDETLELAQGLKNFSESLRLLFETAADQSKLKKAYKVLSERSARAAGQAYEQSAHLYAQIESNAASANTWQKAAELADLLAAWESITDNNPRVFKFYRDQAASRWSRATYYWLQDQRFDRAIASNQQSENSQELNKKKAFVDAE